MTSTSSASCNPERQRGGAGLVGTYLRSRACNATSAPLRSGPFFFSSHASLPLLLQTWSHFYLFCLSYPLLFLASSFFSFLQVTKPLPFLASVQEHRDSLGTRSLAETQTLRLPRGATTAAKQTERPRYFPPRWRLAARKASSPPDRGTKRRDPSRPPRPNASIMPFDNSRTRSL